MKRLANAGLFLIITTIAILGIPVGNKLYLKNWTKII